MEQAVATFTKLDAIQLAGIPAPLIDALVDDEVLQSDTEGCFTFQDLVLFKAARHLQEKGVPTPKIIVALSNVRQRAVPSVCRDKLKLKNPAQVH